MGSIFKQAAFKSLSHISCYEICLVPVREKVHGSCYAGHSICVAVKGQHGRVSSLVPLLFRRVSETQLRLSDHVPLPTEPSH